MNFPIPFAGCTRVISFPGPIELRDAVVHLAEEEAHSHNFCVAVDGYGLWCSDLAVECLENAGLLPDG